MSRMPQVTSREIVQFLKEQGLVEDRQTGSHLTLYHEERQLTVTVPMHSGCDLGRGIAIRILRDASFSVDDFIRLR